MAKKICSAGRKWDNLIGDCFPKETELGDKTQPSTKPPLLAVVDQVRDPALSPVLWIFVMLATVGSILVLALWLVIYRRTRPSRTPDPEPGQEPPQKTDPPASGPQLPAETTGLTEMFQRAGEASAPCAHLYPGAQAHSMWEEGYTACRGSAKHDGKEEDRGLMTRGHRIPLPATELGGTVLVTAKTV
ncbi:unnamed protein product [Pleuronectes platessa]|uniref:Tumor necrosis factor receptor superfamily member 13C n=1 Tax=Pleuronectes platessa TaxID=8262 RepID=A0A9N7Y2A0_PLEPL|nr:unnamed protein product [Pleuronectes platessa]